MKIFKKISIISLAIVFMFGLAGLTSALTAVSLGDADNFAILAGDGIVFVGAINTTNITGDIGTYANPSITNIAAVVLTGTNHADDATTQLAKDALTTAYGNVAGQTLPSVTTLTESGIDSFDITTHTLTPGIYKSASEIGLTGALTLNGGGDPDAVFIFQAVSALTTAGASSMVLTNGTQACNVFWQVGSSATLGSASFFKGNILALTDITLGTTANVNGRALARNGVVTLDGSNTITTAKCLPKLTVTKTVVNTGGGTKGVGDFPLFLDGFSITSGVASTTTAALHTVSETTNSSYTSVIGGDCAANGTITLAAGTTKACSITNTYTSTSGGAGSTQPRQGNINVVKVVVNDNGRTKTIADFPLFVNNVSVVSGVTNVFPAPADAYIVTEKKDPNYTRTFSGDCDSTGRISLSPGDNRFCIVTNNDIGAPIVVPPVPPLIDLVKTASPLSLPAGPGSVVYTYTLRNVGTVPVVNVTIVGDTCSPIILASGDTDGDKKLDVNETWVHTCTQMLSETHTNNAVATGWANGISAVDIASATVVVGVPVVPPLIHITKIPSSLALAAGGWMVTYTKRITNPGLVALTNVHINDDKCGPVEYLSGDINKDAKLDTNEAWTFTCRTKLTKTTVNTAFAEGEANGLIARDFAIATVVVADAIVPKLPNTGVAPAGNSTPGNAAALASLLVLVSASLLVVRKKRAV